LEKAVSAEAFAHLVSEEVAMWAGGQRRYSTTSEQPTMKYNDDPGYTSLSPRGCRTALEVIPLFCGLRLDEGRQARAFVAIQSRVVDVTRGKDIYLSVRDYRSEPKLFEDWVKDGGIEMRGEIEKGCRELTRQSLLEIFGGAPAAATAAR
jgi:hypothetical protein